MAPLAASVVLRSGSRASLAAGVGSPRVGASSLPAHRSSRWWLEPRRCCERRIDKFDRGERLVAHLAGLDRLGGLDDLLETGFTASGCGCVSAHFRRARRSGLRPALIASVYFAMLPSVSFSRTSRSLVQRSIRIMRESGRSRRSRRSSPTACRARRESARARTPSWAC